MKKVRVTGRVINGARKLAIDYNITDDPRSPLWSSDEDKKVKGFLSI